MPTRPRRAVLCGQNFVICSIHPRSPDNDLVRAETAGDGRLKAFVVAACVIGAIAAFSLSVWTYMAVSMFGFPDGYVTDYQKQQTHL